MRIRLKIDFCEQLLLTLSEFDFARVTHLPFAFSPISPGSISPAAAQTKGRPRLASLRGDHTDRSACYQHRLGCGSCRRRDLPSAHQAPTTALRTSAADRAASAGPLSMNCCSAPSTSRSLRGAASPSSVCDHRLRCQGLRARETGTGVCTSGFCPFFKWESDKLVRGGA